MQRFKNIDRRLITILLIVLVQMLGAAMVIPILPLYAQDTFNLEPQFITLLFAAFFGAQFIGGPWLGRMSDKFGRVPILIISQIGTVFAFALIGAAPSAWVLFAARILDGITGGNIIVAQAYVTDITSKEERTQSLGLVFAMFGLGFIFGPALGGFLSSAFGPRVPFYMAAVAAAIVVLLTWFSLDETITPEKQTAEAKKRSKLGPADILGNSALAITLAISFAIQTVFGLFIASFALYGDAVLLSDYAPEQSELGIGLLYAAIGVAQFLTQSLLLRPLTKRFSEPVIVALGSCSLGVGLLIISFASNPFIGALGGVFFAMGFGTSLPPLQSFVTKLVDDEVRGGILGIMTSINSLGTIIATAVSGTLFAYAMPLPFWTGMALAFLTIIPIMVVLRPAQAELELAEKEALLNNTILQSQSINSAD